LFSVAKLIHLDKTCAEIEFHSKKKSRNILTHTGKNCILLLFAILTPNRRKTMRYSEVQSTIAELEHAKSKMCWLLIRLKTNEERNEIFGLITKICDQVATLENYKHYDNEEND